VTQNVFDDGFLEARSVVVKHKAVGFLVVTEFVQAVGIREFAERAKLGRIQAILELVGNSHQRHAPNYTSSQVRVGGSESNRLKIDVTEAERVCDH
jgi:hypothetical protein